MRGRLAVLALSLVLLAATGCATQHCEVDRPIPGMSDSRHVEQINASGRSWN
jgi:hypothetical protein